MKINEVETTANFRVTQKLQKKNIINRHRPVRASTEVGHEDDQS